MPPSKRQIEEREIRKQRILKGALEVFKLYGLEGATMDQIAQQSGFGKATLYYYFKSKEDVFSAILEDGWENIWESLEPIIADDDGKGVAVPMGLADMNSMLVIGIALEDGTDVVEVKV